MLRSKAISGFLWDISGTFSQHGISFVISIFLARILTPEDFGLVGLSLVFISLSQVFIDFGFASALIQSKQNTSTIYSSVFYINVLSGVLLFLLFQIIAPVIGDFYKNDQVATIVRWLSLSFIFSSLNIVQRTILRKNIQFKQLTIRSVVAQAVGGVVGIVMAFQGAGVYALVCQSLVAALVNTMILWRVAEWRPRLEFSIHEVRKLTGFSTFTFLDQLSTTFFQRLDTLYIGKAFSPQTLGYYTRAESLNGLVTKYTATSFSKVFFPLLSSIQDDELRFNQVYFKAVSVIAFVSFFATGILFFFGEHLILGLFGPQWQPSVFIFQILILKAFSYPINSMMVNAFLSKGKAKENFLIGFFRKAIRLLPLLIGFYFGLKAFLIGIVAINYFLTITNVFFLKKYVKMSASLHFRKIFEGGIVLAIFITLYFYISFSNSPFVNNLIFAGCFASLYIAWNYVIKNEGLLFVLQSGHTAKRKLIDRLSKKNRLNNHVKK